MGSWPAIEAGAGPVDVLINNAAVAVVNRLVEAVGRTTYPPELRPQLRRAGGAVCRQVLPGMLARGRGRIVCVFVVR